MSKKSLLMVATALVIFGLGFLSGMEFKAYQVRSALKQAISSPAESEEPSITEQAEEDKSEIVERAIGDEIELATLRFKVTKAEEKQTLTGGYDRPKVAKEGAKFVVVDIDITNTTDTKFTFFPDDGFRLVDNTNREFTTYPDTIGAVDKYLNVRELPPSITERGRIVYEIPQDANVYNLMVGKAGTTQIFKVALKPD